MKLTLHHCPFACSGVTMNAIEEAGLEYDTASWLAAGSARRAFHHRDAGCTTDL